MRTVNFVLSVVVALTLCSVAKAESGGAKTVTLLDRGEPYEAMTVHAGLLWVGRSRTNFNSDYKVEAYDLNGQIVASKALPHSVTYLYPYTTSSVLAFGTGHTPNLTQYSILERRGSELRAVTTQIPMQAWGNLWAGKIGSLDYFTDMGGNMNDPARDEDPTLASQTIFSMAPGRTPRYLPARVRMPLDGVALANELFIVQKEGIGNPRSNLVVVNPASGRGSPVFSTYRNGLAKIHKVNSGRYVAVSEQEAGKLLLIDPSSRTILAEVSGVGHPRSVASLGHCVLTGDAEERSVSYIDINGLADGEGPKVLGTLTTGLDEDEFRRLTNIAAGPAGEVFVRSSFACNPLAEVCDKDYNRVAVFTSVEAQDLASRCRD